MEPADVFQWRRIILSIFIIVLFLPWNVYAYNTSSIPCVTASIGRPNRGRLINGIPFPQGLGGYKLRSVRRSYTSPEVIGGVLAAIFTVKEKYPNTCDLKLGDFSLPNGGRFWPHKSHQNGRDADIGMYARNNIELPGLVRMTPRTLDPAKTWTLVESLLRSQNVKYIFLNLRLQRVLCRYALKHGVDKEFLKRGFQWASGCRYKSIVRHDGKHSTHLHVRFKTPWSEIAGKRWGKLSKEDLFIIAACQEGYLPHEYLYTAKRKVTVAEISKYLGIRENLIRDWNHLKRNTIEPGTSIKVYKVGYKPLGNIMLARFLRPEIFPSPEHRIIWPCMYCNVDSGSPLELKLTKNVVRFPRATVPQFSSKTKTVFYWIKSGDTLSSIARKFNVSIYDICKWNGISKNRTLSIGKRLKIYAPAKFASYGSRKTIITDRIKKRSCCNIYIVKKGDSLWKISRHLGVPITSLCKLNKISRRTILRPGRKLRWCKGRPGKNSGKSAGRQKTSASKKGGEARKLANSGKAFDLYVVKSGDTLWNIARKKGVTVKDLCRWNNIKPTTVLGIGRKLKIYHRENSGPSLSLLKLNFIPIS